MKMLQVEENTHKQAKIQAAKRDKSIKVYIQDLLDKDKKLIEHSAK